MLCHNCIYFSLQQLRMFNLTISTLINVLQFPLYWDLSSFLSIIYLNYICWFFKYNPLISSFLPQISSWLLVSSFLFMTFALVNLPVFPFGILFVYFLWGPEIWEKEDWACGPTAACWLKSIQTDWEIREIFFFICWILKKQRQCMAHVPSEIFIIRIHCSQRNGSQSWFAYHLQ